MRGGRGQGHDPGGGRRQRRQRRRNASENPANCVGVIGVGAVDDNLQPWAGSRTPALRHAGRTRRAHDRRRHLRAVRLRLRDRHQRRRRDRERQPSPSSAPNSRNVPARHRHPACSTPPVSSRERRAPATTRGATARPGRTQRSPTSCRRTPPTRSTTRWPACPPRPGRRHRGTGDVGPGIPTRLRARRPTGPQTRHRPAAGAGNSDRASSSLGLLVGVVLGLLAVIGLVLFLTLRGRRTAGPAGPGAAVRSARAAPGRPDHPGAPPPRRPTGRPAGRPPRGGPGRVEPVVTRHTRRPLPRRPGATAAGSAAAAVPARRGQRRVHPRVLRASSTRSSAASSPSTRRCSCAHDDYDAAGAELDHYRDGPLGIFLTREWHDLLARHDRGRGHRRRHGEPAPPRPRQRHRLDAPRLQPGLVPGPARRAGRGAAARPTARSATTTAPARRA